MPFEFISINVSFFAFSLDFRCSAIVPSLSVNVTLCEPERGKHLRTKGVSDQYKAQVR